MNTTPTKTRRLGLLNLAIVALSLAFGASAREEGQPAAPPDPALAAARAQVYRTNPQLVKSIMLGGGFGTELSFAIANHMYSRTDAPAIAEPRAKLKIEGRAKLQIEALAPRTWLLRFPIVNVVVFETDAGLVLIDSGYAPAGPALVDALKRISAKPVHTVVFTHYHADHAFGAWALLAAGMRPQIVTEERFIQQMEEDMRTHGVIARNNQQPQAEVPRSWADAVRPTLRDMVALKPGLLLPMHGPAITRAAEIAERLSVQAAMLENISKQVVDGLNAGIRRDLVIDRVALPPELARRDDARELYVSAKDIGRMVAMEHSGWWDDVPSHWDPSPLAGQARELAALAGGSLKLIARALALVDSQPALASQLADWAWLASVEDRAVLQGALAVYANRVARPLPTQEALVYAEHMANLQQKLNALGSAR